MLILGISAFYHDSAIAIIRNGKILFAAQEERYSRVKNDASFPILAIQKGLEFCEISINDIESIAFYDKPFLKFERILESQLDIIPLSYSNFVKLIPGWINEKLFVERTTRKKLKEVGLILPQSTRFYFPEHHLSHAASSFFCSGFEESAILTIDGIGEYSTTTIFYGKGNSITKLAEIEYPHSIGLLYSAMTQFLGFKVNNGEYKMMGLAPYGNRDSAQTKKFIHLIENQLISIKEDGSYRLNMAFFSFERGKTMIDESKWEKLFNLPKRKGDINEDYANLAYAIQHVTEKIIIGLANKTLELTKSKNLCLAGGVALNCVANGKLAQMDSIDHLFIQPAAGDAGGALGAALSLHHIGRDQPRDLSHERNFNGLLGDCLDEEAIKKVLANHQGKKSLHVSKGDLAKIIATEILNDKVVGWAQGRMEFGPRALGSRSILANAFSNKIQSKINLLIKKRESFRPFAPIVLEEDLPLIAPTCSSSPFMLQVHQIHPNLKIEDRPIDPIQWQDKLQIKKSKIPAVTHVDYSTRIQSLHSQREDSLSLLLKEIKRQTRFGIVVNTSFNSSEEPIVSSVEDAYQCFLKNDLDLLVLENHILWRDE